MNRILSTANGMADDFVLDIHVDPQGGVWLAQNNGITRFNPGLSVFGKKERLEGDVQIVTRHGGALYAGTAAGLFRLKAQSGILPQFERVDGVDGSEVAALKPYGTDLLTATNLGCFSRIGDSRQEDI